MDFLLESLKDFLISLKQGVIYYAFLFLILGIGVFLEKLLNRFFYAKKEKVRMLEQRIESLTGILHTLREACLAAAYYIGEGEDPHARNGVMLKLEKAIEAAEGKKAFCE